MLSKPVLARCDNRAQLAKTHRVFGEPDQWMTSAHLVPLGLSAMSFDFFVDWRANPLAVGDELWVKRIANHPVNVLGPDQVLNGAIACGDDLVALEAFSRRYGFTPRYVVFNEGIDWGRAPEPLLLANLAGSAFPTGGSRSLDQIKDAIRGFSGGPVRIGDKGLIYGTTSLECHLSKTDALWPGDADCVLWSSAHGEAMALLEFKKHTIEGPLDDENIQKYMHKDRRKWERLGLLRDKINTRLFCVYYSTNEREDRVKIELLEGPFGGLQDGGSMMMSIAGMSHADIGLAIARAVT